MSYEILAEVAVGLAGFAGIITALRSRSDPLPRLQLVGFIQNVAVVLLLSLLTPLLLATFNDEVILRILCGLLAIYHAYIAFAYAHSARQLIGLPWYQLTLLILTVPVIASKVLVAFGLFPTYMEQVFYFALLWHIGISIYIFCEVLLQTNRVDPNLQERESQED